MLRFFLNKKKSLINISAVTVLIFIILRWFVLIDKYSVNMLFWDQWDFMGGLFEEKGLWELFSWQHGPHRQGVGFFLTKIVADLSGWNTRVECFMIGIVICLAAFVALLLKRRLTGSITALDITIPLLYLSPLQFELFANTPNVSHGAMPLLLITLLYLCWTISNIILRYTLCAVVNFMTIYTGFGVFIGCITPFLFISEFIFAFKTKDKKRKLTAIFFFLISVCSMLSFFINYTFNSAAEGFVFPHPEPLIYLRFILISFATFCGIRGSYPVLYVFAIPVVCSIIWLLLKSVLDTSRSILRGNNDERQDKERVFKQILFIMTAFTLLFSLNLAIGRACLGLGAATACRYLPYMTPGFFALYLFAVNREQVPTQILSVCITFFFISTLSIGKENTAYYNRLRTGKEKWKQAYIQTENIHRSNILSKFKIHPNPKSANLKEKLDYLKKNRLNLYLDAQEH